MDPMSKTFSSETTFVSFDPIFKATRVGNLQNSIVQWHIKTVLIEQHEKIQ